MVSSQSLSAPAKKGLGASDEEHYVIHDSLHCGKMHTKDVTGK